MCRKGGALRHRSRDEPLRCGSNVVVRDFFRSSEKSPVTYIRIHLSVILSHPPLLCKREERFVILLFRFEKYVRFGKRCKNSQVCLKRGRRT